MTDKSTVSHGRQAVFPAVLTALSFLFWLAAHHALSRFFLELPSVLTVLLPLPCLCFAALTAAVLAGWVRTAAVPLAMLLLIGFGIAIPAVGGWSAMHAMTAEYTDPDLYPRIRAQLAAQDPTRAAGLPREIPKDATQIRFSFRPAFGQGGQDLSLQWSEAPGCLQTYAAALSERAQWAGSPRAAEAEPNRVLLQNIDVFADWPQDITVYLLFSRADPPDDWNHGAYTLAAISMDAQQILYQTSKW